MSHATNTDIEGVVESLVDALHRDLRDAYIKGLERAIDIAASETDGDNKSWDNAISTVIAMIGKEITLHRG